MKAREFLTEAKKKADAYAPRDISVDYLEIGKKITAFIKKNCAPWLAVTQNGKQLVYRGVQTPGIEKSYAFLKTVRPDRRPKDTSETGTREFNAAIAAVGGQANRTNSVFVTTDYDQAFEYGPVWIYMPVGDFHYTFSPEWSDWTHDALLGSDAEDLLRADAVAKAQAAHAAQQQAAKKSAKKPPDIPASVRAEAIKSIKSDIKYWTKRYNDSKNATHKKYADQKQALLDDPAKLDQFIKQNFIWKKTDNATAKKFNPNTLLVDPAAYDPKKVARYIIADRDIAKAFKLGHEIMIASTEGLYIREDIYKDYVRPMLLGKTPTPGKTKPRGDYDPSDEYL